MWRSGLLAALQVSQLYVICNDVIVIMKMRHFSMTTGPSSYNEYGGDQVFAVIVGMALLAVVCICALAIAWKATTESKSSGYIGLSAYGGAAQSLTDKHDLNKLGYSQLFPRRLKGLSLFGLSFNLCAVTGSVMLLYGPTMQWGGPSVIGFGLPIAALFALLSAASLAELASAMPSAGGTGFWARALGGRRWGARAGLFGAVSHLATLAFFNMGCALLLDFFISARFGYTSSSFSFWVIAAVITAMQAAVHTWGSAILHKLQSVGVGLQVAVIVVILVVLTWMLWPAPYSPSILYMLYNGELSGTVQAGALLTGCLLLLKLFTGIDGAAHGAEETIEPRIRVPWAIYLSTAYTAIGGIMLLSFMAVTIGVGTGSDVIHDLFITLSSGAGAVITGMFIISALWFSGLQSMTVSSRALFSLAREKFLPFSGYCSAVSFRTHSPLRAAWIAAACAITLIVAARGVGHVDAIRMLAGFIIVFSHTSYAIPIGLKLLGGGSDAMTRLKQVPWRLGSWSAPINWIAFIWLAATSVLAAIFVHHTAIIVAAALLLLTTVMEFKPMKQHTSLSDGREMKGSGLGNE